MKIAIMGAGGIGAYLGALLARAGEDVTLICRGAHLAAIRRDGLQVITREGNFRVPSVRATDDPSSVGPVDVILQCVKLYDVAATSRAMLPMVGPHTMVIPVQNGVVAQEEIAAIVGADKVLGGTVFMSSFVVAPGVVERKADIQILQYGELDGRLSERVRAFEAVGLRAGFTPRPSDNILGELWGKFILLGGTAPMCCLTRKPVGVICADPALRALLRQGMEEIAAIARAKGIRLPDGVIEHGMAFNDKAKPDTKVSMLQDLEAGKPLELEWLNGYAVREARRLGVAVPFQEIAYACIRPWATGTAADPTGALGNP